MGYLRIFISFIVIGSLASTVASDILSKSTHAFAACEDISADNHEQQAEPKHVVASFENNEVHGVGADCTDPCHLGHGHLGHSSFVAATSDLLFSVTEISTKVKFANSSIFDSPVLDGIRRPPKPNL